MAKIGGFSDKNFTEAVKLAQTAQKQAAAANDSANGIQTSLDGKITVGTTAPGNDQAAGHNKGDVWYVTNSSGVYTAQYYFDGVSWIAQKWDENTLSVQNLSALSSNLGYIQNGTLDSISISAATITGGTITSGTLNGGTINGATINGGSISIGADSQVHFYVDSNGLAVGFSGNYLRIGPGNGYMTTVTGGGFSVTGGLLVHNGSDFMGDVQTTGAFIGPTFRVNGSSYLGNSEGEVRFVNSTAGSGYIPLYASTFTKSSQLSEKYNIEDIPTFEGLALVNGMNIKKFDYKKSDNAQADNIGPIIDDENEIGKKQYSVPSELLSKDNDGVSIDTEIGLAILAIQELTKRNTDLNLRIFKLEKEINANG